MKSVLLIVMFPVFGRDFYDYYSSDVQEISNIDECDTANRFCPNFVLSDHRSLYVSSE